MESFLCISKYIWHIRHFQRVSEVEKSNCKVAKRIFLCIVFLYKFHRKNSSIDQIVFGFNLQFCQAKNLIFNKITDEILRKFRWKD